MLEVFADCVGDKTTCSRSCGVPPGRAIGGRPSAPPYLRVLPRVLPGLLVSMALGLAVLIPTGGMAQEQIDRDVLVDALHMPSITLNLQIAFPISDLRVPSTADPVGEIGKLEKQLESQDTAGTHLQLAKLHSWLGNTERAAAEYETVVNMCEQALAKDAGNARAHQQLARALVAQGDEQEAITHIERALMLDKDRWQSHELASYLHARRGLYAHTEGLHWHEVNHFAMSEEEARIAIELAPEEPLPRVALFVAKWVPALLELQADPATALQQLAEYEEASQLLKDAADRAPAYPQLRQYAISAKFAPFFSAQMLNGLSEPIWDDLNEHYRRVLRACRDEFIDLGKMHPKRKPQALLFAGLAEFMMGDRDRMYARFREAADADPHSLGALQTMIGFLAVEQNWQEALRTAEEMLQRNPSSGSGYAWLGRIYAEQGRWLSAEHAFSIAANFPSVQGIANLGLGIVLLKGGADAERAMLPLQIAYGQMPEEPRAILAWGTVLTLLDQVREGRQLVGKALRMLPRTAKLTAVAEELGVVFPQSGGSA